MRTVRRDVAHVWAHKLQEHAKTPGRGNLFCDGATIYSYGRHFPIARHVTDAHGKPCILFTDRSYSVTTAKHLGEVRHAIPDTVPVFTVHDVTARPCADTPNSYQARIDAALGKAGRATKHAEWHMRELTELVAEANALSAAFKLRRHFTMPEGIDAIRAQVKAQAAKHATAERKKAKTLQAARSKQLTEWAGTPLTWKPGRNYMRVSADGSKVETDMHSEVNIGDVRAIAPSVVAMFANGQVYKRNGETLMVGPYPLEAVTATTVRVGCHVFDREEVERITVLVGREKAA